MERCHATLLWGQPRPLTITIPKQHRYYKYYLSILSDLCDMECYLTRKFPWAERENSSIPRKSELYTLLALSIKLHLQKNNHLILLCLKLQQR